MSFLSHEIHIIEADGIRFLANGIIAPNTAKLEAALGPEIPAGVDALVALVEKEDKVLGPIASSLINGVLEAHKADLEVAAQALAAQGINGVPAIVQAMNTVADKLAAN